MDKQLLRITLYATVIYLTSGLVASAVGSPVPLGGDGTHSHGRRDFKGLDNRNYARTFAANLNVGEPRTVRMIYFTPNDWPYRADVVQKMKDTIRTVQTFFAGQMEAYGYGSRTFRVETDSQGEPMVHHVDGQHPFSHYDNTLGHAVVEELEQGFDFDANIYFIVLGTDALRQGSGAHAGGVGRRFGKNGGFGLVPDRFYWDTVAHELGHAFGLKHDFRNTAFIMSYSSSIRLSRCAADFLSVHPYFNQNIPIIEEGSPSTIELISPRIYPAGSRSVPVRLRVSDSEGVHQVLLSAGGLVGCRGFEGERDAIVEFDYDGGFDPDGYSYSLSFVAQHFIGVTVVDKEGNMSDTVFALTESSPHHIATLEGHTGWVESVAFSLDSKKMASAAEDDGIVRLWDVETRRSIATLFGHRVAFSPDGMTLATTVGPIELWDVETGRNIATLEGHTDWVRFVTFSPDGTTLASGSDDGTIKLWDVETERSIATLEGHTDWVRSVTFSPDGTTLASGSDDGTIKLWNTSTLTHIATLEGHPIGVYSVAFSPDGMTLAAGAGRKVRLWDVATKQNSATLPHPYFVVSVSFSPDGKTLASGGGTIKLWDVTTRVNFATFLHPNYVISVSFSPDGEILAAGTTESTVELWDTSMLMGDRLEALDEIDIPDPNLRAAIATALGKLLGNPIFRVNMPTLTELEAREASISDLTGLESATNLRTLRFFDNTISDITPLAGLTHLAELHLWNNTISDITPLAGLTHLAELHLWNNTISDITPLAGLTHLAKLHLWNNTISDITPLAGLPNLTHLNLMDNSISDITPLAGLTNLTWLEFGWNNISDISPLAELTNLIYLNLMDNNISDISAVADLTNLTGIVLHYNPISDISPLAGLTNLGRLLLAYNNISDLSPLVANTGLGAGDEVDVTGNPLSYLSINTHIPELQNRGVTVKFDNSTPQTLLKISGDQHGSPATPLPNPLVVEVRDQNDEVFVGVPVTFAITAGSGTLSITSTTTDSNGRAASILTLGPNLGTNTVSVSAAEIKETVAFTAVAREGVIIPDSNLRAAIATALGIAPGVRISPSEIATLTHLFASNAGIGDLTGLEFATNLTWLNLEGNSISDISPLAGLTNLTSLELGVNSISDLSAVAGLTNLTDLHIGSNRVSDISAVAGLTNLTQLNLEGNSISDLSAVAGLTNLTDLHIGSNRVSDISAVAGLTNLTQLNLEGNSISDISAVAGLTNLTQLNLEGNSISDISAVAGLTNLTQLNLEGNSISDISAVAGLTNLKRLNLSFNSISDISPLAGLTNLNDLDLRDNTISDLSAVAGLTNLNDLDLRDNTISDLSAVAGLTNLTDLHIGSNRVSDISAVAGLTNLTRLRLSSNRVSDISPLIANTGLGEGDKVDVRQNPLSYQSIHTHIPILQSRGVTVDFKAQAHPTLLKILGDNQRRLPGETLAYPFVVEARDENGSPFAGVSVTFAVTKGGGTLSIQTTTTDANGRAESTLTLGPNFGTNTVSASAAGIPVLVTFHAIANHPEYLWSIPAGISLIHVPLKVTVVDGVAKAITSISDLYDVLGGTDTVNLLGTQDPKTQRWFSYTGTPDKGTSADKVLTDDIGILANMKAPVSIRLSGDALGTNGHSSVTLHPGTNLVGLPLRDSRIARVSDLFTIDGIRDNVVTITVSEGGEFKTVGQAGDPGDIPIIGGQAFILNAQRSAAVPISGDGWYNASGPAAAPLVRDAGLPSLFTGIQVTDMTPVLALRGSIADEEIGINRAGFRVIVKNLSTGRAVAAVTKDVRSSRTDSGKSMGTAYQATLVDVETGRAARIGDRFEISVRSSSPLIGVQPVRYTVTAEDVRQGLIQLPALVAYEIPTKTELLANYPNPFNPETWIPYRLAEDALVTLTIYDQTGHVVRTLDVGYRMASAYESRSKAIHWDGRNELGEQVASGIYFYQLSTGDYSATRKMVILK